ncbi:MAG: O-antigen ligase family protein [Patescibacteria group bacterium]
MQKKLEAFVKILIGGTFFVPLALIPSSFIFPFIVPKILIFRSLTLLMLGGFLLLFIINREKYRFRLTGVNTAVIVFFISFSLSSFVGVDWYKSFWDNHERMLGLFTMAHFVIYYFVVSAVARDWSDWRLFLKIFLGAGAVVMILGFMQKADPQFLLNQGSGRVSATLGNGIYYSGYGLFLFFIGLLLFFKEKTPLWRLYAAIGAILGFIGIFVGGTRGTIMGLLVSLPVTIVCYLLAFSKHKKTKIILWIVTALILILCGLGIVFRKSEFVSRVPGVNRFLGTDFTGGDTGGTRFNAWRIAVSGWKERPILGWGPNNYYYTFNKYYEPKFLENGWGETWFDNAHSAVFNTLAVQGLLGLIAYIGLFVVSFGALIKAFYARKIDGHVLAISSGFLAGHFVHNFFVFENPTSYLFFFFFLAFINAQTADYPEVAPLKNEEKFPLSAGVVVAFAVFLFIYATDINPARANTATLRSIQAMYRDPVLGRELYDKAIKIPSPHIDDIRNDFARASAPGMMALLQNNNLDEAKKVFVLAYDELGKNRELHPQDIRVHIEQAQLAGAMAQKTSNAGLVMETEKNLTEALSYSPRRQQLQYMLSMVKLQLGKKNEAIALLKESIDNDPKIEEGWWRLALTYDQAGDNAEARKIIAEAGEKGIVFGSEQGKNAVNGILSKKK